MAYRTRIGILIGAIVVFLVAAPIVLLYTAGYRYNPKKQRVEKVGIIFLRSRPSGAEIYLDGKKRSETTPARLRNLLPGDYDIVVSKKNYTSWEKRLPVESALTTFAEGVAIFKNANAERIELAPEAALGTAEFKTLSRTDQLVSTAKSETARSDGYEIWIDDGNGGHDTITRLSQPIESLIFYGDAGWVIYATDDSIHAIERDGRDKRNDVVLASGQAQIEGLALSSDESVLYFTTGNGDNKTLWKRQLR